MRTAITLARQRAVACTIGFQLAHTSGHAEAAAFGVIGTNGGLIIITQRYHHHRQTSTHLPLALQNLLHFCGSTRSFF
jgi:hypothetical protein